ncbi:hypothetical protein [Methylomagnum sp.]
MNEDITQQRDEFLGRVNQLFLDIESWIQPTELKLVKSKTFILEELLGSYEAPKLIVRTPQGKEIAEITPIGRCILGANGRIDIKGSYDNIGIVHLDQGGPKAIITEHNGDREFTRVSYFYKGIDGAGWYWIEGKLGKGYKFDRELFFDLLSEVSDYERP